MKIVLFFSCYQRYLDQLYRNNVDLGHLCYEDQLNFILKDYFGWQLALVKQLGEQDGYEVKILIINAQQLQKVWARENNCEFEESNWEYDIPLQQVKEFNPDIIWLCLIFSYFGKYLDKLRSHSRKIFAWIAYPPPPSLNLDAVDCILTSHSNFQEYFVDRGQCCEILLPTFEPRIADNFLEIDRDIKCSFIGSLSYGHLQRMEVLKQLVANTPIQIWSSLPKLLSQGLFQPKFIQSYLTMGSVRARMNPSVWGLEMYRILSRSQMTINVHLDAAAGLAGNIRMFESTGMGALLITEDAPNIDKLYKSGEEVITYTSIDDLIDKIAYYIDRPQERESIALAGQARTLKDHSTVQRSQELIEIFSRYLNK
jgi:spore maturation protein CgeB